MIQNIIVFFAVIVSVQSSPDPLAKENINFPENSIPENAIKIYFRNQNDKNNLDPIDLTHPAEVKAKGFSPDKDTVFLIHGWHNNFESPMCETVSEAILTVKDVNVFVVDWSSITDLFYTISVLAIPDVGKVVGGWVQGLVNNNNLNLDNTFVVGHSLGAHVSGVVGSTLGGKLNHIVGLDPAGPDFIEPILFNRLNKDDAKFVQVIHTCGGWLGYFDSVGDVDYYPNGGSSQPGCSQEIIEGGMCSHSRSYLYYTESIVSGGFKAQQCHDYKAYGNNECENNTVSYMGGYMPDTSVKGKFFLDTNSEAPYSKN